MAAAEDGFVGVRRPIGDVAWFDRRKCSPPRVLALDAAKITLNRQIDDTKLSTDKGPNFIHPL